MTLLSKLSKPWSCSALSRMLKISILMYDAILHNDTGVNSKVPLAYLPPEGGGLRSGAVQDPIYPTVLVVGIADKLLIAVHRRVRGSLACDSQRHLDVLGQRRRTTARGSDIWMFPSGHVTLSH